MAFYVPIGLKKNLSAWEDRTNYWDGCGLLGGSLPMLTLCSNIPVGRKKLGLSNWWILF